MHFSQTKTRSNLLGILILSLFAMTLFSCNKSNRDLSPAADKQPGSENVSAKQSGDITTVVPFSRTFYVSCANGGNGEEVELTGNLHVIQKLTTNNNQYTYTYNINPQGLTGVGLTTGEKFVASGGSNGTQSGSLENQQISNTFMEQLRIVGSGATFLVRYKFHVTVTPAGVFTTSTSEEQSDCTTH